MKKLLFIVALFVPVLGWGQMKVGGYAGMFDCNIAGKYTGKKSRTAMGGGVWVEWNARRWLGIKSEISYLPRGGDIEGVRLEANYLGFSVVPRLHVADGSSNARLVVGVGVFTHLLVLGERDVFLNVPDVGPCVELGVEWRWFSVLAKGQVGLMDAVSVLEKVQRWEAFGIGVEVPFLP